MEFLGPHSTVTSIWLVESFWNFAQNTAACLPFYVQNFRKYCHVYHAECKLTGFAITFMTCVSLKFQRDSLTHKLLTDKQAFCKIWISDRFMIGYWWTSKSSMTAVSPLLMQLRYCNVAISYLYCFPLFDGLVQDCSISIGSALEILLPMEIPQSCTKPSMYCSRPLFCEARPPHSSPSPPISFSIQQPTTILSYMTWCLWCCGQPLEALCVYNGAVVGIVLWHLPPLPPQAADCWTATDSGTTAWHW